MRVAGVLKDWILIALSTVIFPESTITGLNIIGYGIGLFFVFVTNWYKALKFACALYNFISTFVDAALCGVVMYNYIKIKDVKATQPITDSLPDRITKVQSINLFNDAALCGVVSIDYMIHNN